MPCGTEVTTGRRCKELRDGLRDELCDRLRDERDKGTHWEDLRGGGCLPGRAARREAAAPGTVTATRESYALSGRTRQNHWEYRGPSALRMTAIPFKHPADATDTAAAKTGGLDW